MAFLEQGGAEPLGRGFRDGDWLVFGSETRGIDESLLAADPEHALRIPQAPGERCLNLSTAAGIGVYHALYRIGKC